MKKCKNRIVIALGSNFKSSENVAWVCQQLNVYFPAIYFSEKEFTKPVDWFTDDPFLNAVAIAYTDHGPSTVTSFFKKLEAECGRSESLNSRGIIPMDIDLLKWNNEVLKPKDLQREYVIKGLNFIEENLIK